MMTFLFFSAPATTGTNGGDIDNAVMVIMVESVSILNTIEKRTCTRTEPKVARRT